MRLIALLLLSLSIGAQELTLCSYNVFFDDRSGVQRYPQIIDYLQRLDTDIIVLQECTPAFSRLLDASALMRGRQRFPPGIESGYGQLIISRFPITRGVVSNLPSAMGRKAPRVDISLGAISLRVIAVHLESLDRPESIHRRMLQLERIALDITGPCIIAGDFNVGDDDSDQPPWPPRLVDAAAGSAEARSASYDIEANPLAARTAVDGEVSRRLDRILCSASLRPRGYRVDRQTMSDHYPIVVTLSVDSQ